MTCEKWYPKLGEAESGRRMLDEAYMVWLTSHMTEQEQLELCRIIKKYESMNANPVSWKDPAWPQRDSERMELLHRYGEIQKAAEERAKQEPPEAEAQFKERWSRAETLRTLGGRLSEAEGNELRELNVWLQNRSAATDSQARKSETNKPLKRGESR